MQYLRGWRALRSDPQWLGKVGVGSLVMLIATCIPIVGQIVLVGWSTLMLRRAVSGQDTPLPRLDFDFHYLMKLFNVGFKAFLAQLLWSLPLYAIAFGSVCCLYAGMGGALAAVGATGGGTGTELRVFFGVMCLGVGLIFAAGAVALASMMPMVVAVMRAEISDDVSAAMRFKEVIDTTRLIWKELLTGLLMLGLIWYAAVVFIGIFTLYVGLFPGAVIFRVIVTYWQAELYQAYLRKGGQPLPIGPLDVEGADPATVAPPGAPPPSGDSPPGPWGGPPPQY